jgi:phage FluMu gp28-like protein
MKAEAIYFLPFQTAVALDESPLILVEKSRQIGIS